LDLHVELHLAQKSVDMMIDDGTNVERLVGGGFLCVVARLVFAEG